MLPNYHDLMQIARPNDKRPRVMQVIISEKHVGRGEPTDPHRVVVQYHTLDGEFLAQSDPWKGESNG